jgi:hypothetical protein
VTPVAPAIAAVSVAMLVVWEASGSRTCTVRFHIVDAYNSANEGVYYCAHSMVPYDQIQYLAAHSGGGTISAQGGSTNSRTISGSTPAYQGNYGASPFATSSRTFDAGFGASGEYQLDYLQNISSIVCHTAMPYPSWVWSTERGPMPAAPHE